MKYRSSHLIYSFSHSIVMLALFFSPTLQAKDAHLLDWGDLAPEGYFESLEKEQESMLGGLFDGIGFGDEEDDESEEAQNAYSELQNKLRAAPIVKELNGKYVKIPGYIVPLDIDFEKGTFSEFLLAPYFGACIHVPPPPSNQIIHVKPANPLKQKWLDDAVWVTGTITTDSIDSEYGFAGYSMNEVDLKVYDGE